MRCPRKREGGRIRGVGGCEVVRGCGGQGEPGQGWDVEGRKGVGPRRARRALCPRAAAVLYECGARGAWAASPRHATASHHYLCRWTPGTLEPTRLDLARPMKSGGGGRAMAGPGGEGTRKEPHAGYACCWSARTRTASATGCCRPPALRGPGRLEGRQPSGPRAALCGGQPTPPPAPPSGSREWSWLPRVHFHTCHSVTYVIFV